jgi:7-keto-8-aminopelargonate synthetase-like enzyme
MDVEKKHKDIFQKCATFEEANRVRALGVYPYFRSIEETRGNEVVCHGKNLVMIGSNNYLGLAQLVALKQLCEAFLELVRYRQLLLM